MSGFHIARLFGQTLLISSVATITFLPSMAQAVREDWHSPLPAATQASPLVAPVRPVTDVYYGTKVVDSYRYMENLKDPQVGAWLKDQNAYTRAVLAKIQGRDALLARIKQLDESTPAKVTDVRRLPNSRYFYRKRLASENISRLYVRDGLNGAERLLFDPEKYPAPKGSHNAINYYEPSWNGNLVAVGMSPGGSENAVIHIINADTGEEFKETIDRARFGAVHWRPDNHSFFYNRLQKLAPGQPAEEEEQKSIDYLHVIGMSPKSDVPVLGFGISSRVEVAPIDIPLIVTAPGSSFALAYLLHGVQNEVTLYDAPLDSVGKPDTPWQKVCDVKDDVTQSAIHGDVLYLVTHKDAPRFQVIRTSAAYPDIEHAATVVPESQTVINNVSAAEDALYIQETDGTVGLLKRLSYGGGQLEDIRLPFQGAVGVAASDQRVSGVLLDMTSWVRAPRIYSYEPQSNRIEDTKLQPSAPNDNPTDITSEEVKVKTWDGVMVPLSIVYNRSLKMDGSNPALLNGYGAYGITIDPFFDPKLLAWLEKGGVYAVAHVRGGGVYGEDWHKSGMKLTKPNTWRDFIACAEYLINHKFTSSSKLAGEGASAGGITVGRAFTERPDLFAAALTGLVSRTPCGPNFPPTARQTFRNSEASKRKRALKTFTSWTRTFTSARVYGIRLSC